MVDLTRLVEPKNCDTVQGEDDEDTLSMPDQKSTRKKKTRYMSIGLDRKRKSLKSFPVYVSPDSPFAFAPLQTNQTRAGTGTRVQGPNSARVNAP